jgi:CRP-like cAMP-binding protein
MSDAFAFERFRGVSLFEGQDEEALQELSMNFEELSLPAGSKVFRQGDDSPALYLLVEGVIEISLAVPGGGQALIVALEPATVFGESSFFHPAPHHATAVCRTDATLLRLSRATYDQLLSRRSLAAFRLGAKAAEILAARLQATDGWIAELLSEEQQAILAHWRRFREGLGGSFEVPHGFLRPF